jgi:hypothetical protein
LGFETIQERERLRQEELARKAREEAEAEQRKREEEEAAARAVQEAAEREAALEQRRREKAMALGAEPEKGPDVTQVCVLITGFRFSFRKSLLPSLCTYSLDISSDIHQS